MMVTDGGGDYNCGIGTSFDDYDDANNYDDDDNQYSTFYPADRDETRSIELCTPFA